MPTDFGDNGWVAFLGSSAMTCVTIAGTHFSMVGNGHASFAWDVRVG